MSLQTNDLYEFEDFRLDLTEKTLTRTGELVPITPKVFETLQLLLENAGHLIGKDELMEKLWQERFVEESNLTFNIKMLRKALGDDASKPTFIETVPKRGYRFIAQVKRIEPESEEKQTRANGRNDLSIVQPHGLSSAPPSSRVHSQEASVLALADWVREPEIVRSEESKGRTTKPALALVKPEFKARRNSRILAAAVGVMALAGIGYYFLNAARGGDAIDSLAVMPFVNAAGEANTEHLSEGISDAVINGLTRLKGIKVKSLNSVLRYKGKDVDPQTVGRDLGVRAVLIGKITRQGETLAISAELVDVRDGHRLWGQQYNSEMSDILAVQREIATGVSDALRLGLTTDEKKLLVKQHTENTDAYLLYSWGNYFFRQNTKEAFEKSIESFEQAIKVDPNYTLAYTGLARTYQFMGSRAFGPPNETEQKVEWAALKALRLDESLAEGHVYLGVHKFSEFDWSGAEKEIRRALELDPDSSQANSAYAYYLTGLGQAVEGLPFAIKAQELDANPSPGELAFAYFMARQYDTAIERYRKVLEKKPDNPHAQILLGEALTANGMTADGVVETQKGIALDTALGKTPERWDRYPLMAYAYAANGRRGDALNILDEQHKLAQQRYVSPYNFAIIYAALRDNDQAFAWLEKCIEQRTRILSFHFKSRPLFDTLRSDPRYPELLRKMNLIP